ncbi:MAG TPA: hypothetical protein VIG49_16035, partial [Acetobacteraceae bacterium]
MLVVMDEPQDILQRDASRILFSGILFYHLHDVLKTLLEIGWRELVTVHDTPLRARLCPQGIRHLDQCR